MINHHFELNTGKKGISLHYPKYQSFDHSPPKHLLLWKFEFEVQYSRNLSLDFHLFSKWNLLVGESKTVCLSKDFIQFLILTKLHPIQVWQTLLPLLNLPSKKIRLIFKDKSRDNTLHLLSPPQNLFAKIKEGKLALLYLREKHFSRLTPCKSLYLSLSNC